MREYAKDKIYYSLLGLDDLIAHVNNCENDENELDRAIDIYNGIRQTLIELDIPSEQIEKAEFIANWLHQYAGRKLGVGEKTLLFGAEKLIRQYVIIS